jgi:hypothetical protein
MTEQVAVKQAVLVRHYRPGGKLGDAALYWLSAPMWMEYAPAEPPYNYVVVSSRDGGSDVLGADGIGHIDTWVPLNTSGLPVGHREALEAMGYEIAEWGEVKA